MKLFGVVARFCVTNACFKSDDTYDEVHDLVETPSEGLRDVFMCKESLSLGCNNVLPHPLNHSRISPISSLPSHSLEYYIDMPIENPMI